ncbi:conserved hypothetical protein, partial [Ricinus communis]
MRGIAEGRQALAELHLGILHQLDDLHRTIDWVAGAGRGFGAEAERDFGALARRETDLDGNRIPDRSDRSARHTAGQQFLEDDGRIPRRAAAGIVPDIGDDHRPGLGGDRPRHRFLLVDLRHHERAALGKQLHSEFARQRRTLLRPVVGDDQQLGAHLRHVADHKAVNDRDRQDLRVFLLDLHDLVDEGAHRIARCREDVDHAAIEHRIDGLYPAFERIDGDPPQILGAIDEIGMREFLEIDGKVQRSDALLREVAVRIEFGADQHVGADHLAHAAQEIAFGILISGSDHGAVQAHDDGIDRHCRLQLVEDFVAQLFIGIAVDEAGGVCPGGRALDQLPALFGSDAAADGDRRGAERRRFRMLARRRIEGRLEGTAIHTDRGKGISLGRQCCRENAQVSWPYFVGPASTHRVRQVAGESADLPPSF